MGWTDDRVALLKKLWAEGLSASQIAKQVGGVTRNAVIGKVHRLGLAGRATPSRPAKRQVRVAKARPAPVATAASVPKARPPTPPQTISDTSLLEPLRGADGTTTNVLNLSDRVCKWPIGDPADAGFAFCGRAACGGPYCAEHTRLAYQPSAQKKRRAPAETGDELRRMLRYASL